MQCSVAGGNPEPVDVRAVVVSDQLDRDESDQHRDHHRLSRISSEWSDDGVTRVDVFAYEADAQRDARGSVIKCVAEQRTQAGEVVFKVLCSLTMYVVS